MTHCLFSPDSQIKEIRVSLTVPTTFGHLVVFFKRMSACSAGNPTYNLCSAHILNDIHDQFADNQRVAAASD